MPHSFRFRALFALAALLAVASCDRSPAASAPGEVQFATGASLPPVPGFAARATIETIIGTRRVELSWQDVAGEDIYLVQWRAGETAAWKTLVTTGRDRTGYGTDSVRAGVRNYYRIAAMTSAFQAGPFSTVVLGPSVKGGVVQQSGDSLAILRTELRHFGPATATYWMEIGTDPGLADAVETSRIVTADSASWHDFDVPIVSGTRYYYRAVGTSSTGTMLDSIRSFVGGMAAPPAIQLTFHAQAWDSSWVHIPAYRVQVDWTQPPGAVAQTFSVWRRPVGSGAWAPLAVLGSEDRRYLDLSVPIAFSARYEYKVDACNPACVESRPDTVAVTGMPAPQNLTATRTPAGNVVLAWSDLPDDEGYLVQWRADSAAAWKTLVTTAASRVTYTATQVTQGAVNDYRVAGMGSGFRAGAWTSTSVFAAWSLSAQTGAATEPSPGTAALNATVTATGLPADAWFEWGTSPTLATFSSTPASQVLGSGVAVSDTITAPAPGTYYYRVAVSNGQHTGRSHIRSVGVGLPAAPVLAVSFSTDTYVSYLTWTHSGAGSPTTFRIYRDSNLLREVSSAARSLTDAQIAISVPGRTHTYRVEACNSTLHCTASAERPVSITPMPAPATVTATRLADGSVQVQWQDLPGDQQYLVQWRTSATTSWQTLVSTGNNLAAYTTTRVTAGTTNHYRVAAVVPVYRSGLFREALLMVP